MKVVDDLRTDPVAVNNAAPQGRKRKAIIASEVSSVAVSGADMAVRRARLARRAPPTLAVLRT